jgi:glycolate oxidase FAD binding subunit
MCIAANYLSPICRGSEMSAESVIESLRQAVLQAARQRQALRIRGGGSKDFYGEPAGGAVLDVSTLRGIISYEPSELVITAYCGTPLAEVQAALAQAGQMLAFEPPAFAAQATLGGVIAAGLSGPRRAWAGGVRDFVLGASLLDGSGRHLHFGGQVMKNVAGYDVSRLLAGSMGILGVITQVSLKVLPVPAAEASMRMACPAAQAVEWLNQWGGQPLPLSASAWHDGQLRIRLSGAQAAVRAASERLAREAGLSTMADDESQIFWSAVREQSHPFFQGVKPLWRLSVPSTAACVDALDDASLIEWGGALRWLRSDEPAAQIRERAARLGGTASLFRGGDRSAGVFHPLGDALLALHRRLKAEFDPAGIFNPGRLVVGL